MKYKRERERERKENRTYKRIRLDKVSNVIALVVEVVVVVVAVMFSIEVHVFRLNLLLFLLSSIQCSSNLIQREQASKQNTYVTRANVAIVFPYLTVHLNEARCFALLGLVLVIVFHL